MVTGAGDGREASGGRRIHSETARAESGEPETKATNRERLNECGGREREGRGEVGLGFGAWGAGCVAFYSGGASGCGGLGRR